MLTRTATFAAVDCYWPLGVHLAAFHIRKRGCTPCRCECEDERSVEVTKTPWRTRIRAERHGKKQSERGTIQQDVRDVLTLLTGSWVTFRD